MRASNLISGVCCARGDVQAQLERDRLLPTLIAGAVGSDPTSEGRRGCLFSRPMW